MTGSPLLLPPLLDAMMAWQEEQSEATRQQLDSALSDLAERVGLDGIHIEADASPLIAIEIGRGTLRERPSGEGVPLRGPWRGERLGRAWLDGPKPARVMAQRAVEFALEAMRADLRARHAQQHLDALDAAVRSVSSVLDLEEVLQLIVDRVRGLADARYAALGIVDDDGDIERFITSGISAEERARIGNPPRGRGLLGLIIREGRSFRIPDIGQHPDGYGFPRHHPAMRSFLGVPVVIKGRSVGNFYLTNKVGAESFSETDQALVEMFSHHAAIAIENARLHEAVQRLAIVDERDRISKELHDGIIQSIYAVTLTLDDVPDMLEDDPQQARERIDRAIDALNGVTRDIRNFIFGLRPILLQEGGLQAGLEMLAGETERNTAVEVDVRLTDLPGLSIEVIADLLAIAREALSNVARHAGATHAWVELASTAEGMRLVIGDDGRGFDAVHPRFGHHGLANIQSRARGLGGTLEVDSAVARGTRIIVSLPHHGGTAAEGGTEQ